jgi:cytochrome c biogenesis protein CcdA
VALFGAAGLLVGAAATALARALPWAGLAVGLLLVATGGRLLAGGALATDLAGRAADRLGAGARRADGRGFFAFGLAYGLASLGCTLPIFLTVVGSALATDGPPAAAGQLPLYALGMGGVVTALTLGAVVAESALLAWARRVGRLLQPAGAVLVLLAGAYLIYYWLTLGGLLAGLGAG